MIAYDKQLHFLVGIIIATYSSIFGAGPVVAMGLVVIAGVLKEVFDRFRYGLFDKMDLLWTIIGGVSATITLRLLGV